MYGIVTPLGAQAIRSWNASSCLLRKHALKAKSCLRSWMLGPACFENGQPLSSARGPTLVISAWVYTLVARVPRGSSCDHPDNADRFILWWQGFLGGVAVTILTTQTASIARESLALSTPYEAPSRGLETLVTEVFAQALGLESVGANDDFFDLGGDSLTAEVIGMNIAERTGCAFQLSTLVEHGSPRKIAALLGDLSQETVTTPVAVQGRPPIFVVHGRQGFTLLKPTFRNALADGQKLFMFELPGIRGGRCCDHIEDIAANYVGQLVEKHPKGPVLLAAFCMGSVIALEMASQLSKIGRPVHQLALIDPSLPLTKSWLRVSLDPSHRIAKALVRRLPRYLFPMSQVWLRCVPHFVHELRFRRSLEKERREGMESYPELRLSLRAQAKLRAAYLRYKPKPFHGPVAILLSSRTRATSYPNADIWAELIPERQRRISPSTAARVNYLLPKQSVRLFDGEHQDISGSVQVARLLQSVYDDALLTS
jgi:thioesterase domain-containing protein/acyl carrier protein